MRLERQSRARAHRIVLAEDLDRFVSSEDAARISA